MAAEANKVVKYSPGNKLLKMKKPSKASTIQLPSLKTIMPPSLSINITDSSYAKTPPDMLKNRQQSKEFFPDIFKNSYREYATIE